MTPQKCQLLQQLHNCFFAVCACHRATGLKNSSNMKRFFVSARSQVNLFMNLTFESTPHRHSIKILIKSTVWLGVTTLFLKCFLAGWYSSWRGSSLLRLRFSFRFSLDSFSRSCSNSFSRSLLTTIIAGNNLKISIFIEDVDLIILNFRIPTP